MMIYSGLCSLTLARLQPAEIIALCGEEGLTHIEWWGKDHVPMGDTATAATVRELTHEAGLQISSYGSYYCVGESEAQGLAFDNVLETTLALNAPAIRVWAGSKGSEVCCEAEKDSVIAETLRIAERCREAGVDLIFEYHAGTLTDSNESAVAFAAAVMHPAVRFGWQCRTGASMIENAEGLRGMLPRLATMHVFNWSKGADGAFVRYPLCEGVDEWKRHFDMVSETGRKHIALLEFVRENSVEQFKEDARVLRELVAKTRSLM
jgi:3-dehydroshikimate dehydratase